MPGSEPSTGAASTGGAASPGVERVRRRRWKRSRRGIGYLGYWVRGNVRPLNRIFAGLFAVAMVWASVAWLRVAADRLDPCAGLVPQLSSCRPPAAAWRGLQFSLAVLGGLVTLVAALLAARFALAGREPRREPKMLRPLVVVDLVLVIAWLIVVTLTGDITVALELDS